MFWTIETKKVAIFSIQLCVEIKYVMQLGLDQCQKPVFLERECKRFLDWAALHYILLLKGLLPFTSFLPFPGLPFPPTRGRVPHTFPHPGMPPPSPLSGQGCQLACNEAEQLKMFPQLDRNLQLAKKVCPRSSY